MKKSRFNLTHLHSTTLDPGYLVPFLLQPTLPNDSFRIGLSTFIRAQPMLAPLMHEVRLFTQYWFVPYRLLWNNWELFITGGQDLSATPSFPTITFDDDDVKVGSLTDYFGFPLVKGVKVSAMPYRAAALIWNERYRDEDLQAELPVSFDDGEDNTTSRALLSPSFAKDYFTVARPFTQRGGDILVPVSTNTGGSGGVVGTDVRFRIIVWYGGGASLYQGFAQQNITEAEINEAVDKFFKDALTNGTLDDLIAPANFFTAQPSASGILSKDNMDKYTVLNKNITFQTAASATYTLRMYVCCYPISSKQFESATPVFNGVATNAFGEALNGNVIGNATTLEGTDRGVSYSSADTARFPNGKAKQVSMLTYTMLPTASNAFPSDVAQYPVGRWNSVNNAQVSGFTIRDLRTSSALQRYAERSLEWGNRYEEFIQREFGIRPRDARIQRPEYLGGGRGVLNISEVLQTAEADDTGVGTMRGHGIASISQRSIRFRCPEHGLIIGFLSIRPKSVYTQGVDREWLKRSRLDFFTPELASIGMQEVLQQELYAQPDNVEEIFGYSDRYQEYRYHKPVVCGEFRGNLSFWNMARIFNSPPALNPQFIDMGYSAADFKRPFQIQDDGAHSFVVMLKNHIRAYRPIPKRAKNILR